MKEMSAIQGTVNTVIDNQQTILYSLTQKNSV